MILVLKQNNNIRKDKGGLAVISSNHKNKSMLASLGWRLFSKLWANTLIMKSKRTSRIWKNIIKTGGNCVTITSFGVSEMVEKLAFGIFLGFQCITLRSCIEGPLTSNEDNMRRLSSPFHHESWMLEFR